MFFRTNRFRAMVVTTLIVALAIVGFRPSAGGLAQEVDLNPGAATPNSLGPTIPPELTDFANDWPAPQQNLAAHRRATDSPINAENVSEMGVAWTAPVEAAGAFGGMTAQPIIVDDTVYVQDMESNIFAYDRASGELRWERQYGIPSAGPNGVAIGYGMIYGGLGDTGEAVALDAGTGEQVWRTDLTNNPGMGVDMAPIVYNNTVYISTVPGNSDSFYEGGQSGTLYALDAQTGAILWPFNTTTDNLWGNPAINSGGGLWYPPSVNEDGHLFFGVGNPGPWPGLVAFGTPFPNGSSRPGPNDYTNSVVSLDAQTGSLRWYYNAQPHDLFDLDFQNTPVLATVELGGIERELVIGSGKAGTVLAADASTGAILWETEVGMHQNDDLQEIPEGETIRVYPGTLGGVETAIAFGDDTVFVPIVNRWNEYTSLEQAGEQPITEATGELIALNATDGSVKWQVDLPQMALGAATVVNDLVFTATLDGMVRAFDVESGDEVWTYQANAGINAQLAVAGDLLIVPAAGPLLGGPEGIETRPEVVALKLGASGAATPAAATPAAATPVAAAATPEAANGDQPTVEMVDIDFNPNEFTIPANTDVTVMLPNEGAIVHNFNIDELGISSGDVQPGNTGEVTINAEAGEYTYYCNVPGHREAGMVGTLTVE